MCGQVPLLYVQFITHDSSVPFMAALHVAYQESAVGLVRIGRQGLYSTGEVG